MKYILSIIVAVLMFTACENEMPFDVKSNPPKLILNALLDSEKAENDIILGFTGREHASFVTDATIDISLNGELKEQITSETYPPDEYGIPVYKTTLRFSPKDVIKIEARTNDGKHHAWAEVVVPEPIEIEKIDTTIFIKKLYWDYLKFLRVKTTFTDNGQGRNYYRLSMEKHLTLKFIDPMGGDGIIETYVLPDNLIIREDIVLTDGRPSINDDDDIGLILPAENKYGVFDNSRINGTYTMTASIRYDAYIFFDPSEFEILDLRLKIRLMSISNMQYLYLKALNIYDSVDYDDYFNLPIKFPSNVNGGTGMVGVSTESSVSLPL